MPRAETGQAEAIRRIAEAKRSKTTALDLSSIRLTAIPDSLAQLSQLQELDLSGNQITVIPNSLAQLSQLQTLLLHDNQITEIPDSLVQLSRLQKLHLSSNQITSIPHPLVGLSQLQLLNLHDNKIRIIPDFLAQLSQLEQLYLHNNQITAIPGSLAGLSRLQLLNLDGNKITTIPDSLGQLSRLQTLLLSVNQITAIPDSLGQLSRLQTLQLNGNKITTIPDSLAQLSQLQELEIYNNPLTYPPPEIVRQGTKAIFTYLRAQATESRPQWVSKLLIVGEGGVGKTSLLRALRGNPFNPQEETTHGITRTKLPLPHPEQKAVTMQLNAWDFGGQQIYHATHQFFLTARSLYLLVWNARLGFEQSKLDYWLDAIHARAPESPVLLVATAAFEGRPADLPLAELRAKYPQIVDSYSVSNRDGTNIQEVRAAIADASAKLPLMGERWPAPWLRTAEFLRSSHRDVLSASDFRGTMTKLGIDATQQKVLASWLHELGDILYFQDDLELKDLVILRPDWVTACVARVLDSAAVAQEKGVFTRECMDDLWSDLQADMREHFLRLMEKFDLSYRTLENREISIVVERLPWEPALFDDPWNRVASQNNCKQVSMKFVFGSTIPAGLPTWFLARSHRFTTHTHWRAGALFQDSPGQGHLALVRADSLDRTIHLTVRGPVPQNFFALMRDGLELTIARFPGLQVRRLVPCPGHDGTPCKHEFDYADLERAINRPKPVLEIQCPMAFESVSVPGLLFGIHWSSQGAVLDRIEELEASSKARHLETISEIAALRELAQREFLSAFRRDQESVDAQCPNVLVLVPAASSAQLLTLGGAHGKSLWAEWADALLGTQLDLQLCCQMPGAWHPSGAAYTIRDPAKWLVFVAPYLKRLVSLLKYAMPLAGPSLGIAAPAFHWTKETEEAFKQKIEFTKALVEKLPESGAERVPGFTERLSELPGSARAQGAELRTLRQMLDHLDPRQTWGNLSIVVTPEGHYLWLCPEHQSSTRNASSRGSS